jgi:hypothetical protein
MNKQKQQIALLPTESMLKKKVELRAWQAMEDHQPLEAFGTRKEDAMVAMDRWLVPSSIPCFCTCFGSRFGKK